MTEPNNTPDSFDTSESTTTTEQDARHKARQQKLKAAVDARVAAASDEKGILLVLTGNGKGKSTAGFGTVARAVGHGKNAAVVQFIKGTWDCGERKLLENAGVQFEVMGTGFTWDTQDRAKDTAAAEKAWQAAEAWLKDDSIDVLLLDELTYMVSFHHLDLDKVLTALNNRPPMQHVIITGRNCHRQLIDLADTVSEIANVKHAFDSGIKAQPGFDY